MERIGRYEIIRELGRGAMGVVYHARDPKIGREIAIKTIKLADQATSSEVENLRERLIREAQSAGRLSHPGIVTIYDVDEEEGLAYISMELVQGNTLESLLKRGRIEELDFIADVVKQAAAALDYAHAKGIVHRDVKPANLMLTAEGVVKIMDFGIARVSSSQLTQTGTVMGTPSYMSPEQVRGESLDGRSDQFSLGVIAYEMLTGRKPFVGENLTTVIFKIISEPPRRAGDICPWVSPELDASIVKCLSKSPEERFSDCKEFAAEFAVGCRAAAATKSASESADPDTTAPSMAAYVPGEEPGERHEPTLIDATMPPPPPESVEEEEERADEPASREARGLPPLARGEERAAGERLPSGSWRRALEEEPEPSGRWKTAVGVLLAVILVGAGALAVVNPQALSDPLGAIEALFVNGAPTADVAADDPPEPAAAVAEIAPPEIAPADGEPPAATDSGAPKSTAPEPQASTPPAATGSSGQTATPETTAPPASEPAPKAPEPAVKKEVRTPPPPPPKPIRAAVYFRTNQVGANVVVDNRAEWTCTTPCRIDDIPAGRHNVIASLEGFHNAARSFTIDDSDTEIVEIDLEDARVVVLISSDPPGANIYVDGRRVPQRTNAKLPLARGTYSIKVSKEGYVEPEEQVIVVDPTGFPAARFILQPK